MKKETILLVLKEIRDILKDNVPVVPTVAKQQKIEYFKITDTPNKKTSDILNEMEAKFNVYAFYTDEQLDKDFPPPKKETSRYFKKNIEADKEHKKKSANDLEKEGVEGITLRERLFMELEYFNETGNHLDVESITLCAGSRDSDGSVPSVFWYAGRRKVFVDWDFPGSRSASLRTRAAVS